MNNKNKISIFIVSLALFFITNINGISYAQTELNDINTFSNSNYYESAIVSPMQIPKWQHMPITVSIDSDKNVDHVKNAFYTWEKAAGGIIRFKIIDSEKFSDISVHFVDKFDDLSGEQGFAAGLSKPYYRGNNIIRAEIYLLTTNPKTGEVLPESKVYLIALHEIGHTLGVIGHSPYKGDIMYKGSSDEPLKSISTRDANTLKLIYLSNPVSKNTAMKIPEYKLKEAEDNIKAFNNNPLLWIKYGDIYREYGHYLEAIDIYQKAKKLDNENSQANYLIGLCYYKIKQFQESYYYIKNALELEPLNTVYLNSYVRVCAKVDKKETAKKYLYDFINKNPKLKDDSLVKDSIKIISTW